MTTGQVTTGSPGPVCGDGVTGYPEECDDGNTEDGDGCDSQCEVEYYERDYTCGNKCLADTVISVSIPIGKPSEVTYSFNKTTSSSCDVSHFALFNVPECTEIVNVTSDPPSCLSSWEIPDECNPDGTPSKKCDKIGPCSKYWKKENGFGRPVKVDISGNDCSVTFTFAHNMTYTELPMGLKGGTECTKDGDCVALVPETCYVPGEMVFPEAKCHWDYGNNTCVSVFSYSVNDATVVIIPRDPQRNFVSPTPLPGTDNLPSVFFAVFEDVGYSAYYSCNSTQFVDWIVDGEDAAIDSSSDTCTDCLGDDIPDAVNIERGETDCNYDGVPDVCQQDLKDSNNNGILDNCEIPPADTESTLSPRDEANLIAVFIGFSVAAVLIGCIIMSRYSVKGPRALKINKKTKPSRSDVEMTPTRQPLLPMGRY